MSISVFPATWGQLRQRVADKAEELALLHAPYEFGGASKKGFDCSGLVVMAYDLVGVQLPHNAAEQAKLFNKDPNAQLLSMSRHQHVLLPGDLVFYEGTIKGLNFGHVAVYLRTVGPMVEVAQATDEDHGSEVIAARKYVNPVAIGHVTR